MGDGTVDSNWWYGVLIAGILEPVAFLTPVVLAEAGLYTQEMVDSGEINAFAYLGLLMVVAMLFSIPILGICLYLDATAIAESGLDWTPRPRLWGIGGAVVPIVGFVAGTPLIWAVALVYLLRRVRAGDGSVVPDVL
jgi:hypothetical protein